MDMAQPKKMCRSRLTRVKRTTIKSDFLHASPLAQVVQGGTRHSKALRGQIDTRFDGSALEVIATDVDEKPIGR